MVRVAAVQYAVGEDVGANLETALRMIDSAVAQGAEVVVLPEFGNHVSWYADREHAHRHAESLDGEFVAALADRAEKHAIHLMANVTLAREDGRVAGSNLLFGPDGAILAVSDKQVLMGSERDHLDGAVDRAGVVDTAIGRVGLYSCMDGVIFETPRTLAVEGAQLLLNSLNSFALDEASLHVPVRAAENKVWVVAANKVGPLVPEHSIEKVASQVGVPVDRLHGAGESQVVAPDGTVVAIGPRTGEAVVLADIDLSLADDKTRPDGTDVMAARRPAGVRAPGRGAAGSARARRGPRRSGPAHSRRPLATTSRPWWPPRSPEAPTWWCCPSWPPTPTAWPGLPRTRPWCPRRCAGRWREPAPWSCPACWTPTALMWVSWSRQPASSWSSRSCTAVVATASWRCRRSPSRRSRSHEAPWGRLAVVVGDDALYPETFRLAALSDADVVAVPFTVAEPHDLDLLLLERAAENRLNLAVSARAGRLGGAALIPLSADFTLWGAWRNPFAGVISRPELVTAQGPLVVGTLRPACATNRFVSRGTDVVDGRPWQLLDALVR